jgi:cobalt/nickel transport system ATP-binding protein
VMEQGRLVAEGETLQVFEQLQSMPSFEIGMPLIWQMWSQLSAKLPEDSAPRSIAEFTSYLEKYTSKR